MKKKKCIYQINVVSKSYHISFCEQISWDYFNLSNVSPYKIPQLQIHVVNCHISQLFLTSCTKALIICYLRKWKSEIALRRYYGRCCLLVCELQCLFTRLQKINLLSFASSKCLGYLNERHYDKLGW